MIVVVLRDVDVVADLVPETTLETMFELAITLVLGTPEVETELDDLDGDWFDDILLESWLGIIDVAVLAWLLLLIVTVVDTMGMETITVDPDGISGIVVRPLGPTARLAELDATDDEDAADVVNAVEEEEGAATSFAHRP